MSNRLSSETSPYLLQHASNPVDWYPWGPEALKKAVDEQKPIFLSVGYSACHWCHVMEHECFEDEDVARVLNKDFISIKVDREERPDIDDIYMASVQVLTGSGGWPMSVFMTPDQKPFYAGTYLPKEDRPGVTGLITVLNHLSNLWKEDSNKCQSVGQQLVEELRRQLQSSSGTSPLPENLHESALKSLQEEYEPKYGGFGGAPKFPAPMVLDIYGDWLRRHSDEEGEILKQLRFTLRSMAQGGMYDQIGGGFHRYSTDGKWLVPHFEKMLYDNALLARCYLESSLVTDGAFNEHIGLEICDYIVKEMTHENGAFFSSTDADSEGTEGVFFLWHRDEVISVLGEEEGASFCELYQITVPTRGTLDFEGGTPPEEWFHGRIPHLLEDFEETKTSGISFEKLQNWKKQLYRAREERVRPGLDDKVLTSWNGMMNTALSVAFRVTGRTSYLELALKNMEFIWSELQLAGRLHATWKDGRARHLGTLDDYANVAEALLELFKVTGDPLHLNRAKILADATLSHFVDSDGKAFFYTANDAESLIVRSKNPFDNAVPCANSVLLGVLYSLSGLLGDEKYAHGADGIVEEYSDMMGRSPRGFARMIRELCHELSGRREWVLLGASESLRAKVSRVLLPGDLMVDESSTDLPLLEGKGSVEVATLFLCEKGSCQKPLEGESEILKHLKSMSK